MTFTRISINPAIRAGVPVSPDAHPGCHHRRLVRQRDGRDGDSGGLPATCS
jgi:hypothetical protein